MRWLFHVSRDVLVYRIAVVGWFGLNCAYGGLAMSEVELFEKLSARSDLSDARVEFREECDKTMEKIRENFFKVVAEKLRRAS